jgi:hypothetical protein
MYAFWLIFYELLICFYFDLKYFFSGYATVYCGIKNGHEYALKVIWAESSDTFDEFRREMSKELEIVANLETIPS